MDSNDEWLQEWRNADQVTIETRRDPLTQLLLEACGTGDGVEIIYFGGSTPGTSRVIFPRRLFRVKGYGSIYVEAYCRAREADRIFRLDKIELPYPTYATSSRYITATPKRSLGCQVYTIHR